MRQSDEQLAAITSTSPRLLIIAGAGSGKTHCMAARANYLFDHTTVKPERTIAITFTVKSGNELRHRIGSDRHLLHSGTIHGLCYREAHKWGVWHATPSIMTDDEADASMREIIKSLRLPADVTVKAVSAALAAGIPLEIFGKAGLAAKVFRRTCIENGRTTMDLLLHEGVKHLAKHLGELDAIFWDEYQDSGPGDKALLDSLGAEFTTVVCDPSQSIYGFRGARVENVLEIMLSPDWQVLKLTKNYRSTPDIVKAANKLAHKSGIQMEAAGLATEGTTGRSLMQFSNEVEEIGWLQRLITVEQAPDKTLAILTRHNALAKRLEAGLLPILAASSTGGHPKAALQEAFLFANAMRAVFPYEPDLGQILRAYSQDGAAKGFTISAAYIREFWQGNMTDTCTALRQAIDQASEEEAKSLYGNITIGTVHSVKGLEFDTVVIAGAEAALWPGQKKNGQREEESRIMYVAITRARSILYYTAVDNRRSLFGNTMQTSSPSPFVV